MADETEATETDKTSVATESEQTESEAVLDVEAIDETEDVDELRDLVEKQQEQIEELNDLLLDLSTRVADGNSMGVCPDCHGAVMKFNPWFRSAKIKCTDCGRVFHEY